MEETLSLEELYLLIDSKSKEEHNRRKFAAALKGIDLEDNTNSRFEDIQREAEDILSGRSEEERVFDFIGIEVETDDDE